MSTLRKSDTVPQVFIVESLELDDEAKGRREGEVLAAVLRMCGKEPLYYYIRTKAELELMAKRFEDSGYRYLHISCHSDGKTLETTLDSVNYEEFSEIFQGKLKNRRLFVSACGAGNEFFAELIVKKNQEVISIAAPSTDIRFDHAVAFWSSFYVKIFSIKGYMSSNRIVQVLKPLAKFFSAPMHLSRKGTEGEWLHEVFDG